MVSSSLKLLLVSKSITTNALSSSISLLTAAAIPAGAPSAGVLSASCPLIGASDVKDEGFLDDSGMESAEDCAMAPPSTNSDLASCSPAGIAVTAVGELTFLELNGDALLHLRKGRRQL